MARSDYYTLLPLDTYARFLGVAPTVFNRLDFPSISPKPYALSSKNAKQSFWYQHEWQAQGQVSIDEIAKAIQSAEDSVRGFLGYFPAPYWTSQEMHDYPRENRTEYYGSGIDSHGQSKAIKTRYGRVIAPGRRNTTLLGTPAVSGASLVYTDPNGLGYDTIATITVPTTLTSASEIRVFFTGHSGDQTWEVRPVTSKTITGGNVVIVVPAELLVDPDLINAVPHDESTIIDGAVAGNYVQSVEVRRVYTDFTQASATFYWENPCSSCSSLTSTCTECLVSGQDGCFHLRDVYSGFIVPNAATYNDTDGAWDGAAWAEGREPDYLEIWYYSGEQSEQWLRGDAVEPMSDLLIRAISSIATARLTCDFRENNNVAQFVEYHRRNVTESFPDGSTIFTPPKIMLNPFGVRQGEVDAYRMLAHNVVRNLSVAAVPA